MIWHNAKRYSTWAALLAKHNTCISSFNTSICLYQHKKWIRQLPLSKRDETVVQIMACGQGGRGWSVCVQQAPLRMEWNSLSSSWKGCCCGTWQSGPNFGFNGVSLIDHLLLCVSVCACVDSIGRQLSSDSAVERERLNNERGSYCWAGELWRRKLIHWLCSALR